MHGSRIFVSSTTYMYYSVILTCSKDDLASTAFID